VFIKINAFLIYTRNLFAFIYFRFSSYLSKINAYQHIHIFDIDFTCNDYKIMYTFDIALYTKCSLGGTSFACNVAVFYFFFTLFLLFSAFKYLDFVPAVFIARQHPYHR